MIAFHDTWPSLDRLWSLRHQPFRHPFMGEQRVCITCSGLFVAGEYRAHLRSVAHRIDDLAPGAIDCIGCRIKRDTTRSERSLLALEEGTR